MAKFFSLLFFLGILAAIGAFVALGFMDFEIPQENVTIQTNLHEIRSEKP